MVSLTSFLRKIVLFSFLILIILGGFSFARAAFNEKINYQGKLTNPSGIAVANGSYNIRFRLCAASDCTGGSDPIWTETLCYSPDSGATCNGTGTDQRVSVSGGLFSVLAGNVSSLSSVNFNQTLYLEVQVGGSGTAPSWETLTPRKALGAVPAAFEAKQLGGKTWAAPDTIGSGTANTGAFTTLSSTYSGASGALTVTQSSTGKIVDLLGDSITTGTGMALSADGLTTGTAFDISSTSIVGGGSGVSKLLNLSRSGANSNTAHTAYGLYSAVTNTNATSGTNIAGYFSASGATTANYGLIVENGDVGIGTATPLGKLDIVNGAARTGTPPTTPSLYITGAFSDGTTGSAANNIEFRHNNQTQGIGFGYQTIYATGSNAFQVLNLLSHGSAPITLNAYGYSTGNVGIGTTGPDRKLDILDASNPQLRLTQTDGITYADMQVDSNGDLLMNVDGRTNQLVLDDGGNVGIGTATPSSALHVLSTATITSATQIIANSVTTGKALYIQANSLAGGYGLYIDSSSAVGGDLAAIAASGAFGGDLLILQGGSMTGRGLYINGGTGSNPAVRIEGGTRTGAIFDIPATRGFTVYSGGNVGLGDGTPDAALEIVDASADLLMLSSSVSADGDRLIVKGSGLVGIGTTGPDRKLDILDASNPQLRLTQTDGITYADMQVDSNGDLLMNVDGRTNQLVLDDGGNVGIGTAAPGDNLHIFESDSGTNTILTSFRQERLTSGVAAAGLGLAQDFYLEDDAGNSNQAARIDVVWEDATNASEDASIRFNQMKAGVLTEAMRIDDLGRVGIGVTAPIGALDVFGDAAVFTRSITGTISSPQSAIQIGLKGGTQQNGSGPSFLFFADDSAGNKEFLGRVNGISLNYETLFYQINPSNLKPSKFLRFS